MRTPAGFECPFFYGDYRRGRHHEECRLIGDAPPPHHYTPDLCAKCAVPGILRANACDHMVLAAEATAGILGKFRKVKVSAYCRKSHQNVAEPHIGCGHCHELGELFTGEEAG